MPKTHLPQPSRISFSRLLKISRPKFWHYLGGPYAIAMILVFQQIGLSKWSSTITLATIIFSIVGFFWYLTVGNFFIYGVNDYFDRDTDLLNPDKKNNQDEILLNADEQDSLKKWLWLSFLSGIIVWLSAAILDFSNSIHIPGIGISSLGLILFFFFSWGYSAPPIRAKGRPIVDGLFNILYVLPVISAFGLTGQWPNFYIITAATLWCMAMHSFSAIPDIKADRKVHLKTTAVLLGEKGTLIYCLLCYLGASLLVRGLPLWQYWLGLLSIYVLVIVVLLALPIHNTKKFYRYFPYLNLISGMTIFLVLLHQYFFKFF